MKVFKSRFAEKLEAEDRARKDAAERAEAERRALLDKKRQYANIVKVRVFLFLSSYLKEMI